MRTHAYKIWLFLLFTTLSSFAIRSVDIDQIKSSDRTKTWTLPTTGLVASVGTIEVSNGTSTLSNKTFVAPVLGAATGTSLGLGGALDASALLGVTSTTKGFLGPRVTQAQRDAIASPASGLQVYNTDSGKLNVYNGTSWGEVGSGSSGVNYITDADGSAIGAWATYKDAAASSPVDGTGGAPTFTYTVSTNSDIRGTSNFLVTHGTTNQQGEGFSYAFTINPADKGKVLQISLEYLVSSGTYSDDDLQFWIYDVTNSALIQPAPFKLKNSSIIEKFALEFQTSSNSTSYRLIAHVATSTATAYTIRFDNWNLGPQAKLYGSPITDWVSFTPTGSWSANSTYTGQWRRVGDSAEIIVNVALSGAPTSAGLTINLPTGLTIDTAKLTSTTVLQLDGTGTAYDTSANEYYKASVFYSSTTAIQVRSQTSDATYSGQPPITQIVPVTFATGDSINVRFKVPIVGWSSSVQMSDSADTRVVAFSLANNTSTSAVNTTHTTAQAGAATLVNTHSVYNGSTTVTIPNPGIYRASVIVGTGAATGTKSVNFYKNGSVVGTALGGSTSAYQVISGSLVFSANAGDLITVDYHNQSGTTENWNLSNWSVERLSGPSQIAASETVAARYTSSAGNSLTSTGILDFSTKDFDSHNAVTTGASWKFTAPISGTYQISYKIKSNTSTTEYNTGIFANGVQKTLEESVPTHQTGTSIYNNRGLTNGSTLVKLLAGQDANVRVTYAATVGTLATQDTLNYIDIVRVGNY